VTTLPTFESSKKPGEGAVSRADLMHACMRNQLQAHDLIIRAVDKSGMTQKELAKRTGIDEATLSRILGQPKNLEINTISKIVYAACGAMLTLSFSYPRTQRSAVVLLMDVQPSTMDSTMLRNFTYAPIDHLSASAAVQVSTNQNAFEMMASSVSSRVRVTEVAPHA